jgi:hypothetical protein
MNTYSEESCRVFQSRFIDENARLNCLHYLQCKQKNLCPTCCVGGLSWCHSCQDSFPVQEKSPDTFLLLFC